VSCSDFKGGVGRTPSRSSLEPAAAEHRQRSRSLLLILITILAAAPTFAAEPPVLHGEWVAAVGSSKALRGQWIGQAVPGQPDVMQGSWTLKGSTGRTVLHGTWTAHMSGSEWRGTWSASDQAGRKTSGTWNADGLKTEGKSLEGLFLASFKDWVSGSWRSGPQKGDWWLKGSASRDRKAQPH
jgi:hypothetical protein